MTTNIEPEELTLILAAFQKVTRERDELRAEVERLRAAFGYLSPFCRRCDRSLTAEDVIAIEQPGEDGVWLHRACWEAEIAI
jgi:hypothetical protein